MLLNSSTMVDIALILSESISILGPASSSGFASSAACSASVSFAAFFSGFSPSSASSSASCFSAASLASFSAYALFSASIFFYRSMRILIFSKFFSRVCLNSGVSCFQLPSSFFKVSFSSYIRLLFPSRCSVKWLRYSICFYFSMVSIWSKMGSYFYFRVAW